MENLTKSYLNRLTYKVLGAAIEVHKELGPGLLESVYHKCLDYELTLRNIPFIAQTIIPIHYKGLILDAELRYDFFVAQSLIVEIKAVETVLPIHVAQLMTYMKLMKIPKGILINFNVTNLFSEGQKTYVNKLFRSLPDE